MKSGSVVLSLTLLVLGDFTDHANFAVTMNHLALITNLLDRCSYFHCSASSPRVTEIRGKIMCAAGYL